MNMKPYIDLSAVLYQPKVLLGLVLVWIVIVGVGSSVAIAVTQFSTLSDADAERILSENERLARNANVAYAQERDSEDAATPQAYPARLVIDKIGTDLPISNPQTRDVQALDEELKSAAVRYPDSAALGEEGANTLVFGHSSRLPVVRNQLYKAFNDIETLEEGDVIKVVAETGDTYRYRVTRVYQASAEDDSIPITTPDHRLTLLTCDSFGKRSDRWVVEAEFTGIEHRG